MTQETADIMKTFDNSSDVEADIDRIVNSRVARYRLTLECIVKSLEQDLKENVPTNTKKLIEVITDVLD